MSQQLTPWSVLRDGAGLIGRFIKARPGSFALGVTGGAMFAAAIIAAARVVGWLTDQLIIPVLDQGVSPAGLVLPAVAAVMGVALFKAAGIVIRRTSAMWLLYRTRQDTRNSLLAHQLSLKMSWFHDQAIGDLLAVAESDTDQGTGVLGPLPYATGASFLLVGAFAMVTAIDPWLALGAVVGLVTVVAIDVRGSWITYGMWEEVQQGRGKVASLGHESFDGALTVKSLGREEYVSERFGRVSDHLRDRIIEVNSTWTRYQVVIRALPQMLIVILLVLGAVRVEAGHITPGDLVTVAYLLTLLAFPIQLFGFVLWDSAASLAGWSRVQRVLDADDHVSYGTESGRVGAGAAQVAGRAVGFLYDSEPVLSELDLEVSPGTTLAVVGPTGSGKSTLCLLLARLWDPSTGEIRLEGRDLRSFGPSQLPKEVAYVSQNAFLFHASIRENITLGEGFTDGEVREALRLAGAEGLIDELEGGLGAELGERGATLSGGQGQRVALARALVRKPRLLILDDATSAVDPSIEAEILRALKSAELPSTIIVVAYRPASIRLADEVVYLDGKRIVAHGTHRDLLRSTPAYARLVQAYEEESRRLKLEAT